MSANKAAALVVIREISAASKGILSLKQAHLREAVAAGFGFSSWAACCQSQEETARAFSAAQVRRRMRELNPLDADPLYALASGNRIAFFDRAEPGEASTPQTQSIAIEVALTDPEGRPFEGYCLIELPAFTTRKRAVL